MSAQPQMSDAELRHWARSCLSKCRYGTPERATAKAESLTRARRVKLYTYHCTYCGGWHLTRRLLR